MKQAFDKIAAGLGDAIAWAEGDGTRARRATIDVTAIRKANGMTQHVFARTFRLPVGTLRDWEQGRRQPDTGSMLLLKMIAADAVAVQRIIAKV